MYSVQTEWWCQQLLGDSSALVDHLTLDFDLCCSSKPPRWTKFCTLRSSIAQNAGVRNLSQSCLQQSHKTITQHQSGMADPGIMLGTARRFAKHVDVASNWIMQPSATARRTSWCKSTWNTIQSSCSIPDLDSHIHTWFCSGIVFAVQMFHFWRKRVPYYCLVLTQLLGHLHDGEANNTCKTMC